MSELNDLIHAGIRQQKELDSANFTSDTRLKYLDCPLLLMIVLAADPSLKPLSFEECQSYLTENGSLLGPLGVAYSSKSFPALLNHPLLRTLAEGAGNTISEPGALVKSDSNRSLQAAFEEPYLGNVHQHFISVLDEYPLSGSADTPAEPYNRSISVIQSSGMGKSRMVDEAANIIFTIPANLREPLSSTLTTYPPPDTQIRSYFENHEKKSDILLQAEYAILLKHIFKTAASLITDVAGGLEGSDLARTWADFLKSGGSETVIGNNRISFYKTVVDAANEDISKIYEEVEGGYRQLKKTTNLQDLRHEVGLLLQSGDLAPEFSGGPI